MLEGPSKEPRQLGSQDAATPMIQGIRDDRGFFLILFFLVIFFFFTGVLLYSTIRNNLFMEEVISWNKSKGLAMILEWGWRWVRVTPILTPKEGDKRGEDNKN